MYDFVEIDFILSVKGSFWKILSMVVVYLSCQLANYIVELYTEVD